MAVHISVGTDLQGDANLYLQYLDAEGNATEFLTAAELNNRLEDIQEAVGWLFEPGGENPRLKHEEILTIRRALLAYKQILSGQLPNLYQNAIDLREHGRELTIPEITALIYQLGKAEAK